MEQPETNDSFSPWASHLTAEVKWNEFKEKPSAARPPSCFMQTVIYRRFLPLPPGLLHARPTTLIWTHRRAHQASETGWPFTLEKTLVYSVCTNVDGNCLPFSRWRCCCNSSSGLGQMWHHRLHAHKAFFHTHSCEDFWPQERSSLYKFPQIQNSRM